MRTQVNHTHHDQLWPVRYVLCYAKVTKMQPRQHKTPTHREWIQIRNRWPTTWCSKTISGRKLPTLMIRRRDLERLRRLRQPSHQSLLAHLKYAWLSCTLGLMVFLPGRQPAGHTETSQKLGKGCVRLTLHVINHGTTCTCNRMHYPQDDYDWKLVNYDWYKSVSL